MDARYASVETSKNGKVKAKTPIEDANNSLAD
jgi:hypothetical protein